MSNNHSDRIVALEKALKNIEDKTIAEDDVRYYGAKGDGKTDDTQAFQLAINSLYGKTLRVPDGTYNVGSLEVREDIKIIGASRKNTIINHTTGGIAVSIHPEDNIKRWESFLRVYIENIGVKSNSPAVSAIYINQAVHCRFSNIDINGTFTYGFQMDGTSNVVDSLNSLWNNYFHNIDIHGCSIGMDIIGCISDTHFNLVSMGICDVGMYIHSGNNIIHTINNVTFTNCSFGTITDGCLKIENVTMRNVFMSGCNFEKFTNYGIHINPDTRDIKLFTIINSSFFPNQSTATADTVCLYVTKCTGGNINSIQFINMIDNLIGVNTTGSSQIHVSDLQPNNGSIIKHNIHKSCFYSEYKYLHGNDSMQFSNALSAPAIIGGAQIIVDSKGGYDSLKRVNGQLVSVSDYKNLYLLNYYTSSERLTLPNVKTGSSVFDTTLGKPVWYNGTAWVDSVGALV